MENKITVKIKKLCSEAVIPSYAKLDDAAMDVTAISVEKYDKFIQYNTGLALEIPRGHVCLIFPRSSITKKDLILKNSVGVLDSGYRGELVLRYHKTGENNYYKIGERVGQIMILPYPKVKMEEIKELSKSERGKGGWGSTGK